MEKPPATGPLRYDRPRDEDRDGAAPDAGRAHGAGEVQDAGEAEGLQVKFCGGCNPFIDRVGVAGAVRAGLDGPDADGATLYVSGCQRACASRHQLTDEDDARAVVVAGENVDAAPTAAARIPETVLDKFKPPAAPSPSGPPVRPDHRDSVDEG